MKTIELREKTDVELDEELLRLAEEYFRSRVRHAGSQLSEFHLLGRLRRDIARVKTLQRERLAEQVSDAGGSEQ